MTDRTVVILTRFPEAGKVKTRLIPALGPEGAAELHRKMAEFTLKWARALAARRSTSLEIRYDGASHELMEDWLGHGLTFTPQLDGDLGERLARGVRDNLEQGNGSVILVGTDCPQLNAGLVEMSFQALRKKDLVIVPTLDGGYCLIGLKRDIPELFHSISWGTDTVFERTMDRARELDLNFEVFKTLRDVDIPEDLEVWERTSKCSVSVIIPTLNEEDHLGKTLIRLGNVPYGEVLVVDGGSRDGTLDAARQAGITILRSEPGRGIQMNTGASVAKGDILLFLHADTQLPDGFFNAIRRTMADPGYVGGSFTLKMSSGSPGLKLMEKTVEWRTKYLGLPFGDQALFVHASLFREMGGFPEVPLMEDVEFVRRLKRLGRLAVLPEAATTSPRMYADRGFVWRTLINKLVFAGYFLGISPERLFRLYYGKNEPGRIRNGDADPDLKKR